ncbi:MAG: DUF503 domain-containing protein [Gemmatimonadota bacterium]|nr:MAG: DUF503 domain-containing protein [Gemmatimonadota bacterium]
MIVGAIAWELHLDGCASLKEKRAVLRSLKDRLRNRHNVAVAETKYQDRWQRAELCAATVSSDQQRAQQVLSRADALVAADARVRIIDSVTYFF